MRRLSIIALVLAMLWHSSTKKAFALATETIGNGPLSEKNYETWKGIMPLVNDKTRVYENWVNGNEHLFYRGTTQDLNAALAHFAKVEVKNHVVVLRPGPAVQHSFEKTAIPYTWDLHVLGGLARSRANDNAEDLDWQKDPVLTIYIGSEIDLAKIKIPAGVTLRSAPGRSEEAKNNADAEKKIAEFLQARKAENQK